MANFSRRGRPLQRAQSAPAALYARPVSTARRQNQTARRSSTYARRTVASGRATPGPAEGVGAVSFGHRQVRQRVRPRALGGKKSFAHAGAAGEAKSRAVIAAAAARALGSVVARRAPARACHTPQPPARAPRELPPSCARAARAHAPRPPSLVSGVVTGFRRSMRQARFARASCPLRQAGGPVPLQALLGTPVSGAPAGGDRRSREHRRRM